MSGRAMSSSEGNPAASVRAFSCCASGSASGNGPCDRSANQNAERVLGARARKAEGSQLGLRLWEQRLCLPVLERRRDSGIESHLRDAHAFATTLHRRLGEPNPLRGFD